MGKSYFELLNEISEAEIYEELLGYGLFSEKLPPVFQSIEFRRYCQTVRKQKFSGCEHSYVNYLSNRNTNTPRSLAIPYPMAFENLCNEISRSWDKILNHFEIKTSNQKHKVSRIHLRRLMGSNGLFNMNYQNWEVDGDPVPDLVIGKRYEVKCDISQCYPSVYTHSIPWALVGKKVSKLKREGKEWFNKLDKYTRNMKSGETHGILIGPHTSNLLSEIILCSIDYELVKKGWVYIRHIDDYTCYVDTKEKAEEFLVDINQQLREFGLSLNHKKTNILNLPFSDTNRWTNILKSSTTNFQKFKSYVDYYEVKSFLNLCLSLMEKNKENSAIILYGIKILDGLILTKNAQNYFVKSIISLSLIYPYVVPLLNKYIFEKYEIVHEDKSRYINMIFSKYRNLNNYESCSFAIFYAFSNDVELESFNIDKIIESEDCILATMALLYCKKFKKNDDLKKLKTKAEEIIQNGDLEDFWVFIYEALPYSNIPGELKNLKKHKISFLLDKYKFDIKS
ncbi:RNA-directed DNA polymerase [Erysipelothrix rhusiopathiae]|nr:RNA-directed DNA polymerase [Erysipelothrix rhusiopathiae]